jgi:hypothetical protein
MTQDKKNQPSADAQRSSLSGARNLEKSVVAADDSIDCGDFELVKTERLQAILDSGDREQLGQISRIANSETDGVLVQDRDSGAFDLVTTARVEKLLEKSDTAVESSLATEESTLDPADAGDGLALVDTMMLKRMLGEVPDAPELESGETDLGGDPYNSSKVFR